MKAFRFESFSAASKLTYHTENETIVALFEIGKMLIVIKYCDTKEVTENLVH
jgi:hypothetical protein